MESIGFESGSAQITLCLQELCEKHAIKEKPDFFKNKSRSRESAHTELLEIFLKGKQENRIFPRTAM